MGKVKLARVCAVLALMTPLLSCGAGSEEPRVALRGKVMWAEALYPDRCGKSTCQATYQVRIRNDTDSVLYVPKCRVLPPVRGIRRLPVMGVGLQIRAGATQTWIATFRLTATASDIHRLTGAALRCFGTDGTGQVVE